MSVTSKSEFNSILSDKTPSSTNFHRWYGELNHGRSSLQDEIREGHPKPVIVPKFIDAVLEPILEDHHVTFREIETTTILHRHSFKLDITQFINRSKQASFDWSIKKQWLSMIWCIES